MNIKKTVSKIALGGLLLASASGITVKVKDYYTETPLKNLEIDLSVPLISRCSGSYGDEPTKINTNICYELLEIYDINKSGNIDEVEAHLASHDAQVLGKAFHVNTQETAKSLSLALRLRLLMQKLHAGESLVFTDEILSFIRENNGLYLIEELTSNPAFPITKEDLKAIALYPDCPFSLGIFRNPNYHPSEIDKMQARNDPFSIQAYKIALNPNIKIDELDRKVIRYSPNSLYADGIAKNKHRKIEDEDIFFARDNIDSTFAYNLMANPSYKIQELDKEIARNNPDSLYAEGVLENPNFKMEKIDEIVAKEEPPNWFAVKMQEQRLKRSPKTQKETAFKKSYEDLLELLKRDSFLLRLKERFTLQNLATIRSNPSKYVVSPYHDFPLDRIANLSKALKNALGYKLGNTLSINECAWLIEQGLYDSDKNGFLDLIEQHIIFHDVESLGQINRKNTLESSNNLHAVMRLFKLLALQNIDELFELTQKDVDYIRNNVNAAFVELAQSALYPFDEAIDPEIARSHPNSLFAYYITQCPLFLVNDKSISFAQERIDSMYAMGITQAPSFPTTGFAKEIARKNPYSRYAKGITLNQNYEIEEEDIKVKKSNPYSPFAVNLRERQEENLL